MPIFEFVCQTCNSPFEELLRSSSEIDTVQCPDCGGTQVRKKMSTFAARVMGGSSFSFNPSAAASCSPGGST